MIWFSWRNWLETSETHLTQKTCSTLVQSGSSQQTGKERWCLIFNTAFCQMNNLMMVWPWRGGGESSCIINVLGRLTACQIWVWFVMHRRHTVSFSAWFVHVWMPVHVCGQGPGRHDGSSQSLLSSEFLRCDDISISIMLSEDINTV